MRNKQRKRIIIVVLTIYSLFGIALIRLIDLMILKHDFFVKKAFTQYLTTKRIIVDRGNVFDRKGRPLALNLQAISVYLNPKLVRSKESVLNVLERDLSVPVNRAYRLLNSQNSFVWITRKSDLSLSIQRIEEIQRIQGLGIFQDSKRIYPKGSLAAHVLGFVDIDNRGLEGIERYYDDLLSMKVIEIHTRKDAEGHLLFTSTPPEGNSNNLVLSIDEGIQLIVEEEINRAMKEFHPKAAVAIIMDPYTGEILAMTNRPTFNPNKFSKYSSSSRRNRAITDPYEPGSTFKIVMLAAAIEERIATESTKVDCSKGYIDVAGKRIWDIHKYGVLTLTEVIQKSSNVGAIKITQKIGPQKYYEYVKRFGFGEKTGIDLTGESGGFVRPIKNWSATTLAAMAIGYEVMATPLQLLRAYAVVANGGYLVKPHLGILVISKEGRIMERAEVVRKRIISSRTALILRKIFSTVVNEGTGKRAAIEGNSMAGKTGTTRLIDPKTRRYSRKDFVSSFVGMIPAENPVFVGIVVFWKPKGKYYGGEVAAPVFGRIADKVLSYMLIPREDKKKNILFVGAQG